MTCVFSYRKCDDLIVVSRNLVDVSIPDQDPVDNLLSNGILIKPQPIVP
jgi:hypothetical protein